ncbi:DUF4328 domain-containing protein [Nannocystis bainbridge]|uniref:DUF4328 domain-containing protein n=1 Tax=Nannocystis bainbridge TaxID=2995303 RepID=A0ABT5E658_9BACT|nr:DUF4328 domain-containing protein [Nannocystis bainbridge]MDC0721345.1 DUF4328 domain-containing protein [Nannocystis bainbridge]
MSARQHHLSFAKKVIPAETFRAPDRMFEELTGPKREAFLFFLWTESGKGMVEALPHVGLAPGGREMAKLDVVGHVKSGAVEVVVISMPPALNANEAMFLALVRKAGEPSVFFYERCADLGTGTVHVKEAVLAETRPDGSRSNYGFHEGLDLPAFKAQLEKILEVSLAGLEGSLEPVTAAAFMATGTGRSGVGRSTIRRPPEKKGPKHGGLLELLLLVRFGLPLVMFALAYTVPALGFRLWQVVGPLYTLLSLVIGVALLVFLYRVYAANRLGTPFGPGMAVAGWLVPGLNFFMPPLVVRGAHKAVVGTGAGLLVLVWWLGWLLQMTNEIVRGMKAQLTRVDGGAWHVSFPTGGGFSLPDPLGDIYIHLSSGIGGLAVTLAAYAILWHLVRSIRAKL